jgi:hypothetical protein
VKNSMEYANNSIKCKLIYMWAMVIATDTINNISENEAYRRANEGKMWENEKNVH